MTKRIRFYLLVAVALVFLGVAPAVILYAIGFRPVPATGVVQQVGVLLVETIPKEAILKIDNEEVGRTPEAASNLPVGEIRASLTRDGYDSWEKTLAIEPVRTTEVSRVRLFPSQPSRDIIIKNVDTFNLSPNRSLLAIVTTDKDLHIVTQNGEDIAPPLKLASIPKQALWSPDSTSLLIQYPDESFELVDVTARLSRKQLVPALSGATQITWDSRIPGRLFAIDKNESLFTYNVATENKEVLSSQVSTFALSSRSILTTTETDIQVFSLQGQLNEAIRTPLNRNIEKLYVTPAGLIAAHFKDGSVDVLDKNNMFQSVTNYAEKVAWAPNGLMLLLQTAHNELSIFNVDDERIRDIPLQKMHLIVRLSQTITHPQWFAGGTHLIYQVGDEIILTETDTRDHPISYTVDTTNTNDAGATVGENGDIIYYIKENTSGTPSLYGTSLLTAEDLE